MGTTCDTCGKEFTAGRADARYCSGRCRTVAYRRRAQPDVKPRPRRPLDETLRGTWLDLDRLLRRYERVLEDDRFPRQRSKLIRHRTDLVRVRDTIDALLARWPADAPPAPVDTPAMVVDTTYRRPAWKETPSETAARVIAERGRR